MLTTTATTGTAATTTMSVTATTMMKIMPTRGSNVNGNGSTSVSRGITTDTATSTTTTTTTAETKTKRVSTITSDPGILCFHHCNVKVFCFTLPHICPQCKTALVTHPSGDTNSETGINSGSSNSSRRKNKKLTMANKNEESNNYNADYSRHSIDFNKDDGNNHHHVGENGDDGDSNDDNEDDLNSFTSHIMASSRLLPFRLPYPFIRANQYPCAIVLRPTTGDFLNDYNNTTDLHIAVTTSTGCVVEFDRHGLRRHRTDNMSEWRQCLLVGDVPEPWYDYWDQVLFEICQQPDKWTVSHYHEDKHNCYTFVLTFLQALTYDKLSEAASSKTRFCEKYIVPRTTTAGKYISLYRKLCETGIYVHHTSHYKVRYAKQRKRLQQQQQQQQQEQQKVCQQQQENPNKSNNLTTTTAEVKTEMSLPKNSLEANKQKQHLSNHHNHHSIIFRPHTTLCTIEE